jgi:hypothetical protein
MLRTRGTISRTQRSPPVNRPGGGVHRWYVSQGSEATGLFGRVTVVLGGAQPADHRCAQFSLKRCGNSYLAKHWRRIHHSWRRRDVQWRSGPRDVLGVPFGEGCVQRRTSRGVPVAFSGIASARAAALWTTRRHLVSGGRRTTNGQGSAAQVQCRSHVMSMQQARIVAVPFVPQTSRVGASQIPTRLGFWFVHLGLTFVHRLFSCGRADVHRLALGFRCHP